MDADAQLLNRLAIQKQVRLLVFSDSHNHEESMIKLAQAHLEADLILHLGDHCASLSELGLRFSQPLLGVAGNCDGWTGRNLPDQLLLTLAGYRVFMTHGHLYGVKQRLRTLLDTAAAEPYLADVILFGHTHQALEKQLTHQGRQILLLNPGSARRSLYGSPASAAIIDLQPDRLICQGLLDQT